MEVELENVDCQTEVECTAALTSESNHIVHGGMSRIRNELADFKVTI